MLELDNIIAIKSETAPRFNIDPKTHSDGKDQSMQLSGIARRKLFIIHANESHTDSQLWIYI